MILKYLKEVEGSNLKNGILLKGTHALISQVAGWLFYDQERRVKGW
jgi:hypothetical protein